MNKKEKNMKEAIENFHEVYYSVDNNLEGVMKLHHAAEHMFNAAEIKSSIAPKGKNKRFWNQAASGEEPCEELRSGWDRILGSFKKENK